MMDVKFHAFPPATGGKKQDFCLQGPPCVIYKSFCVYGCACDKTLQLEMITIH